MKIDFELNSLETNIFFTSDTHFGHKKIIQFCNRPFNSVEEMDNTLIENWNNTVSKDDIVFHLGDFAFATNGKWKEFINKLNGNIYLILGNHDCSRWPGDKTISLFNGVYNQLLIKIDNQYIYLNHYPFLCYAGSYRDTPTYQLFGHVHSHPGSSGKDDSRLVNLFPYQYDVGVDNNNFTPISWQEVDNIIKEQIKNIK